MLCCFMLLFLLGAVIPANAQYPCPPQGGAYALCGTTVLYIIDTSADLNPNAIGIEIDWIRNNIIPGTAWGTDQSLALISYGTGNIMSFQPVGLRTKACGQLNTIQTSFEQNGSDNVTLLATMQAVNLHYSQTVDNMVLFTACKDVADIANTANFITASMKNEQLTVIALDGANFTGFPARVIYPVDNLAQGPPNLASCIIKNACDQGSTCNINGATDPPVYFPTTVVTSTQEPTTVRQTTTTTRQPTTTTKQPTTSPGPSPSAGGPQCACDTSKAWNDVMFLLDASSASGSQGLGEIWSLVGTSLDWFTVEKTGFTGSNYTTRVGIITYGTTATVYKPLGSVNNDDIDNITPGDLPFFNGDATNLEDAIQKALAQFASPNHRSNAKKVIVVVATTYNPAGVDAPQGIAHEFREDDGILIVYNYVPFGGGVPPTLEEIASPGYFLTSQNETYQDLNQALCDANCFCDSNYASFTNNYRNNPTGGCYQPVLITANNRLSGQKCGTFNGYLTSDETQDKNTFLSNLMSPDVFWIGLHYDTNSNQWKWADNSTLGSYHPWAGGSAPNGGQCVYVDGNRQWQGTDCRNGYRYVCEASPCDSLHYCP